jgi:hypothetical protein
MTNPLVAIRREVVNRPILKWLKNALPQISDTQGAALETGTVCSDAELKRREKLLPRGRCIGTSLGADPRRDRGGFVGAGRIDPVGSQGVIL